MCFSQVNFTGFIISTYEFRFMTSGRDFHVFIETAVTCSGFTGPFWHPLILKFVQTAFAQLCSHNENAYPAPFCLPSSLQRSVHHRGLCPFVHGGMPFISVFPEARRPSSMCTWIAATKSQSDSSQKLEESQGLICRFCASSERSTGVNEQDFLRERLGEG